MLFSAFESHHFTSSSLMILSIAVNSKRILYRFISVYQKSLLSARLLNNIMILHEYNNPKKFIIVFYNSINLLGLHISVNDTVTIGDLLQPASTGSRGQWCAFIPSSTFSNIVFNGLKSAMVCIFIP